MSALRQLFGRADLYWRGLQPRERTVLAGGGALLAIILGYFLIIDPWRGLQARLDTSLPQLRADLGRMQAMAANVAALKALPQQAASDQAPAVALQQAIARATWPAQPPVLRDDGNGRLHLIVSAARFSDLVAWLEQVQQTSRLRVATATIVRLEGGSGLVRAELGFEAAPPR